MPLSRSHLLVLLGVLLHLVVQARPAAEAVWGSRHGRDFASYYYAVQVAADGGDPYATGRLDAAARADRTRKSVNPYFYPPPFLLGVTWALPLDLATAYRAMFVLNELLLLGCLWVLRRSFGVSLGAIVLLLATFTPIPDNLKMGQANLMALFPALLGLALVERRPALAGLLVGTAAMLKMSPALFLLPWALQRRWTAVGAAVAAAVGWTVVSLPLVGLDAQLRFYTEVLPGFGRGDYHGLAVPISLPANHSIPDLFDRAWPGPTPTSLSDAAQRGSRLVTLGLLALWAWRFGRGRPGEPAALGLGALTVLMVIAPAYTYEHHLVFLLMPVLACATWAPPWAFLPVYALLAWPLDWREWLTATFGAERAGWWRESKFVAELLLMVLLAAWPRRPTA